MKHLLRLCFCLSLLTTGLGAQTLQDFTLNWSGAPGNAAIATGTITIDTSQFATSAPFVPIGTAITALSITVSGATSGNGTFGLADFNTYVFMIGGTPLDFTTELIGQTGFIDFNLFRAGGSPTAPDGVAPFQLAASGGGGTMTLLSFTPSGGAQQSAMTTGLPMANAQGQALINGNNTATNDVNNHLFNLMAGDGEEAANDSIAAAIDDGVVVGQGDGDPDA